MQKKYSRKIKGYRVMQGMSQEEMAKKLGIKRRTYVSKENGQSTFDIHEGLKLAKVLGVSVNDIFL